jgi:hypothetical protein
MHLLNTKIQAIEGVSRTETLLLRPTNWPTDSTLRKVKSEFKKNQTH